MTPAQIAINHSAITEAAESLTAAGYQGDAHALVEQIVLAAVSAGYRKLDRPVPIANTNIATDTQRAAALTTIRTTLRERRQG